MQHMARSGTAGVNLRCQSSDLKGKWIGSVHTSESPADVSLIRGPPDSSADPKVSISIKGVLTHAHSVFEKDAFFLAGVKHSGSKQGAECMSH